MSVLLAKSFKEVSPLTILWLVAAIFGNPFYNMVGYLLLANFGFSDSVGINAEQVNLGMFILLLLIVFALRYVIYRLIYLKKSRFIMNTPYFIETFMERHRWQVISLVTFLMWSSEVEGNIAGFIYFPVTIVMILTVSVVTFVKFIRWDKNLEKKISK